MKYDFRQPIHKEFVGDSKGDLYLNHLKYFEFHDYPGCSLHKVWAVLIVLLVIFNISALFKMSLFIGLASLYLLYISVLTHFLLQKRICRYKGYFIYPKFFIRFFKKRKKDVDYPSMKERS